MNQAHRDQLGRKLTEIALLYGKDLTKDQVTGFINALLNFMPDTFENYLRACDAYAQDPKNKFFPAPVALRSYLKPEASPDAVANEVASRIRQAISKFGWPNPEDAKVYIGELGWKVVERSGGWTYLCENHGVELSPLTYFAQSRDLAKSMIETSNVGTFDMPVALPMNRTDQRSISDRVNEQRNNLIQFMKKKEEQPETT